MRDDPSDRRELFGVVCRPKFWTAADLVGVIRKKTPHPAKDGLASALVVQLS